MAGRAFSDIPKSQANTERNISSPCGLASIAWQQIRDRHIACISIHWTPPAASEVGEIQGASSSSSCACACKPSTSSRAARQLWYHCSSSAMKALCGLLLTGGQPACRLLRRAASKQRMIAACVHGTWQAGLVSIPGCCCGKIEGPVSDSSKIRSTQGGSRFKHSCGGKTLAAGCQTRPTNRTWSVLQSCSI